MLWAWSRKSLCQILNKMSSDRLVKMIDKKVCPWCEKNIEEGQETVTNGGGEQTGGVVEEWHKGCFDKAEEQERDNGSRI